MTENKTEYTEQQRKNYILLITIGFIILFISIAITVYPYRLDEVREFIEPLLSTTTEIT